MKPNRYVIDLETLGTKPGSVIFAVGAVRFDRTGVQAEFYTTIDPRDSMKYGMTIDPDTVMWWMKQSDEARAALVLAEGALRDRLMSFSNWLDRTPAPDIELWGNGANFDNVLLAAAYDACGLDRPWKFYNDRCYRTLKALHPDVPMTRSGTHHNALDDARSQALHLISLPSFQAMCDREEEAAV